MYKSAASNLVISVDTARQSQHSLLATLRSELPSSSKPTNARPSASRTITLQTPVSAIQMSPWYSSLPIFGFFLILHPVAAFDREVCIQSALWMLGNHTITPDSPWFYRDTPSSPPYIHPDNMTLTLTGCNAICGSKQTWYADIGPRLAAWVIPFLLLLINIEVSPLGKRSLLELLHVIGDPIDSLWSLLHKIDAWERCHTLATQDNNLCTSCARIVATVFAGYEEIQGPRLTSGDAEFEALLDRFDLVNHFKEWRHAAVQLADSRIDELVRTLLAFILFLYQLIDNWVPSVGGQPTSPPGSRISIGVLLSCFIPHILLTNAVGGLASRRTAHTVISDLAIRTGDEALQVTDRHSVLLPGLTTVAQGSTSDYHRALAWSGGVYLFRPWKLRYITSGRSSWLHTTSYALLAATPVLIGMVGGSLLLWWQTPRGFNCRHIWLIGVSLLWILSASITMISHNLKFMTGKYHWHFVLVKDAFVAFPSLLMCFLAEAGFYNSCWCWSGPWEYPHGGRVMLPVDFFVSDGTIMYPMDLSVAMLLQFLVVAIIIFSWRRGLRLLRWSEKSRREAFELMQNRDERCRCIFNMRKKHESS